MSEIRLDKYLWAVRIFKTRSDAADAIRNNRVLVNDSYAKPSREVKQGDVISVKRMPITYPQEELDKLNTPRETIFVFRERGTGRPTKKERRDIDALMDGFYLDDEDMDFDE